MHASERIGYLALAMLFALSGCGGGGGAGTTNGGANTGGTAPPTQPAQPAVSPTMTLSRENFFKLPNEILPASEAVLATAQFAVELAQRFQTKGAALTQTLTCASGGQLVVTLSDTDGNGIASAGDRIAAQATGCNPGPYNDVVNGKLGIDIQAGSSLAGDKLNAQVQIDDGFGLARWQVNLGGSFAIAWERSLLAQSWRVSASAGDDLKSMPANGSTSFLRAPSMTKSVDYASARGQVSLAMRFESSAGVALVSTPTPLSAYLNRIADQGVVEFQGANGKVRTTSSRTQSPTQSPTIANIELFLGNSATPDKTSSPVWSELGHGFLWWDGQWRDTFKLQPVFDPQDYIDYTFIQRLVIPDPVRSTSPDAVFRVQFSRPPASLPQLFYRFSDTTAGEPAAVPNIAATAEVHGALLLVRPAQSLSHGRIYVIQASRDGVTWTGPGTLAPDIALTDTAGHELRLYYGGLGNFQTPNTLLASITSDLRPQLVTASDLLRLSAAVKLDSGRSVTAWRWTQLSGTPLRFGATDMATTTVQWGDSKPNGIESAVVQVQVTDSTGDTQVARLAIISTDAASLPVIMFLKREGGVGYGLPPSTYFYTPADEPYMTTVYQPGRTLFRTAAPGGGASAQLALYTPDGAPLAPGHYEQPGAIEMYNLFVNPCTTHAGYYDVREVVYAPDGTLSRLAVDFKHVCDGATPLYGSYRLNSTLPVAK